MHRRTRTELRKHAATLAAVGTVVAAVLLRFSSREQIGELAEYLLGYRWPVTASVVTVMALSLAIGMRLVIRVTRSNDPDRRLLWIGRLIIWITLLTPLVVGAVWWGFFSEGDA